MSLRHLSAALAAAMLVHEIASPARAAPAAYPRERVQEIIREARRITSPQGVEELRAVELNGLPQWISVRGRDRRNPILLVLHGGPASTEMPVSWLYQSAWEDYFTVVQWDQRAAGKTAVGPDHAVVGPTVTLAQMTSDAEALVAHLRERYGKRKVIVLAHSWGTVLGMELARRRPEWLHAYVGMGQVIDWQENERLGYAFALEAARADGNAQAVRELEAIAPYPTADGRTPFEKIVAQRKWVIHYGGLTAGRRDFSYDLNARELSPEYGARDLSPPVPDGDALVRLLPDLEATDFRTVTRLDCPMFLFLGRRDFMTPTAPAEAWAARLRAPRKKVLWFERSAHMMHLEEPGRVLVSLVEEVRPIAAAAGDAAPERRQPGEPGGARR